MSRRVVIVIYDGFQLLDLAGPADAFSVANTVSGRSDYTTEVAAPRPGPVTAGNGLPVVAGHNLADVSGAIDTLVVVGGHTTMEAVADGTVVDDVRRLAARSRRLASVCSGALVLAEAGLLNGRRATTHWLIAEELAARFPDVRVDADAIYVVDDEVWTSAGVTAGIDLTLAMIATDLGHRIARQVASGLVVYLQRPGGQSQFSTHLRARTPGEDRLRELQLYIDTHPGVDLSVPVLAQRVAMSPRHFSRVFTQQTGMSPGKYVERSRADYARRLLETSDRSQDAVAHEAGLGSAENLYRVFRRRWRTSPGDYRRRFRVPPPSEEY